MCAAMFGAGDIGRWIVLLRGRSRVDNLPIRSGTFKADHCRRHGKVRCERKRNRPPRLLELFRIENRVGRSASEGSQGGQEMGFETTFLVGNSRYPVTESPTLCGRLCG